MRVDGKPWAEMERDSERRGDQGALLVSVTMIMAWGGAGRGKISHLTEMEENNNKKTIKERGRELWRECNTELSRPSNHPEAGMCV